jgi:hypothetical protein
MSYVTNKFLQPHSTLYLNAYRPKMPYNAQMDPYLHRLGLYQIAIMGHCQLDKSLLTAFVEKWRPEMSTLLVYNNLEVNNTINLLYKVLFMN